MMQSSLKLKMLEAFRFRMYFFLVIVSIAFFVILAQLFNLQIIQGEEYKTKSKLNMENYIPIPAPRGEIFDRNFKPGSKNVRIVSNRPSFNISTIPANFRKKEHLKEVLHVLSTLLNFNYNEVEEDIKQKNPWERVVIKEDVDFDSIVKIASHQEKFPNISWGDTSVRIYNYNNLFAHVVGYIGSISKEEYNTLKQDGYKYYQKIGKAGLEREYDIILRGVDGFVRRIVDVRNRTEGEEIGMKPLMGNSLVLTIDYEVQKIACEAMQDKKGSVVVIKAATGEVLSLVSKPDYDPNLIISKNNIDIIKELTNDQDRPFLNRAIQSRYPPASTFKLVTAISALEEEKWNPSWTRYCPGKYTLKGYVDRDFYCYDVHGTVDLEWAIAKSCSVYFYQVAYKVGPSIILKYANYFGLGKTTGLGLPGEIPGLLPSKKWKLKTFSQPWFDGDTLNLAIGQGFLSVTPIGMACMISGIVNNGIIYKPYLVKEIRSPESKMVKITEPEKIREIPFSQLTMKVVKNGMRLAVKSGTAGRLSSLKVPVAGKTGTAQTRSKRLEKYSQHAWFVGFAPFDGPQEKSVVVVVMIEYGIGGAVAAVPVAEKIFYKLVSLGYFDDSKK